MDGQQLTRSLCGPGRAGDLSPGLELLRHLLTVCRGRAEVTSWSEVLDNGTIGGEEALGMPWRLEPLHAALALAGGLMRVFRPVIQVAMLAMFHTREHLPLGRAIAAKLIRDDDPRDVR